MKESTMKKVKAEVTIVMTAFNAEDHINEAIDSILNQTFRNFRFIIVNNGSTDNTGRIIDRYASLDSRVKAIHHKGQTYIDGRTRAIAEVETPWFAVMDADDISETTRLERQMQYIKENGTEVGVFGTWAHSINCSGEQLGRMVMEPTTKENFYKLHNTNTAIVPVDPSTIINHECFKQAGGYRASSVPAADLDLWYRIAETGKTIQIIPEFLLKYRIHGKSTSVSKVLLQREKTHFVNYNMRRRRANLKELSWDEFNTTIWSNILYRFPRRRNDLGLVFYKYAGHAYGQRKWFTMTVYLFVSAIFKPVHVAKQILRQKTSLLKIQ